MGNTSWIITKDGNTGIRDLNNLAGDIFINAGDENYNIKKWPCGRWHRLNLTTLFGIPSDAIAVDCIGRLAITSGSYKGASEVEVSFKKPSEPDSYEIHSRYCLQAQCFGGNSAREMCSTIIIPESGYIDFGWNIKPEGPAKYPNTPSFGINLVFKRWQR